MSPGEPELVLRGRRSFVQRFWSDRPGALGRALRVALTPVEAAFAAALRLRALAWRSGLRRAHHAPVPVVSVGNLTVGGEGKTPFAARLVDEFLRRGLQPALLHGGYAADEPTLHRTWHPGVPVYAGPDRVFAAARAASAGAQVVILDDGFQHWRLARDLDIALVATEGWQPRPHLLPNGPWREPASALARAHFIVITRRTATRVEAEAVRKAASRFAPNVPSALVHLAPGEWRAGGNSVAPPSGRVLAVAAIARPDLFAANARAAGADIARVFAYPDHHDYTSEDVRDILDDAAGRQIVTTEKDAVKLASLIPTAQLCVLTQTVTVESGADELARALDALVP